MDHLEQGSNAQAFVLLGLDVLVGETSQNVFAELDLLDDGGCGRAMVVHLVGVDNDLPMVDKLGLGHIDEKEFAPRIFEQHLLVVNGPAEAQTFDEVDDGERYLRCGFGELFDGLWGAGLGRRGRSWRWHWVGSHMVDRRHVCWVLVVKHGCGKGMGK